MKVTFPLKTSDNERKNHFSCYIVKQDYVVTLTNSSMWYLSLCFTVLPKVIDTCKRDEGNYRYKNKKRK